MSSECDETYAVYNEKQREARKEHKCDACDEPIRIGDLYCVVAMVFNGKAEQLKRCLRCQAIHEHLRGLGESDMWPDEQLNCGIEYEEHWGTNPPAEIAALAFVSAEEMQRRAKWAANV